MRDNAVPNERLRHQREIYGWSRNYVAEKIESDPQTVARWERGKTFPSPYYRQKLCELFGKKADELGLIKDTAPHGQYPDQASDLTSSRESGALQNEPGQVATSEHNPTRYMPANLLLQSFLHRSHITRKVIILGLVVLIGAFILSGKFVTIWVSNGITFSRVSNTTVLVRIVPGGLWISPMNGQTINDIIHFAAHAFPTNRGDPVIDHVNFTAGWNGTWRIACVVYPNHVDDTFQCNVSLKRLGAAAGHIQVSFDVYDKMGNVNKAPSGEHTIIYAPSGNR